MLVKINNLVLKDGYADYRGLDMEKVVRGSQLYPPLENTAYFEYEGTVVSSGDIEIVTKEVYEAVKLQIETERPATPEEEIAYLKQQLVAQQSAINMLLGV